jgi:hypothetical protein
LIATSVRDGSDVPRKFGYQQSNKFDKMQGQEEWRGKCKEVFGYRQHWDWFWQWSVEVGFFTNA